MQIDQEHNTWWWNLDFTLCWVVSCGISRILNEGQHLWTDDERADLVKVRDGFAGNEPDDEAWRLLELYRPRLWD